MDVEYTLHVLIIVVVRKPGYPLTHYFLWVE
jgi:hypothetical protein